MKKSVITASYAMVGLAFAAAAQTAHAEDRYNWPMRPSAEQALQGVPERRGYTGGIMRDASGQVARPGGGVRGTGCDSTISDAARENLMRVYATSTKSFALLDPADIRRETLPPAGEERVRAVREFTAARLYPVMGCGDEDLNAAAHAARAGLERGDESALDSYVSLVASRKPDWMKQFLTDDDIKRLASYYLKERNPAPTAQQSEAITQSVLLQRELIARRILKEFLGEALTGRDRQSNVRDIINSIAGVHMEQSGGIDQGNGVQSFPLREGQVSPQPLR